MSNSVQVIDDYEAHVLKLEEARIASPTPISEVLLKAATSQHEAAVRWHKSVAEDLEKTGALRYLLGGAAIDLFGDTAVRVSGDRACSVRCGIRLGKGGQWQICAFAGGLYREWYVEEAAFFSKLEEEKE